MRAALLALMLAGTAHAEPLSDLLMQMPPAQVAPDAPGLPMIQYGNVAAALAAGDDPLQWFRGWPPNLLDTSLPGFANWPATIGFGPADVAQALTLLNPPLKLQVMRFNPGVTARIDIALRGAGYEGEGETLSAGTEGQFAPATADPFRGPLGLPAHIRIDGDRLIHATSAADLPGPPGPLPPTLSALLPGEEVLRGVIFPRAPTVVTRSDPRGVPGGALRWQGMALYDLPGGRALLVLTLPPLTGDEAVALRDALAEAGEAQLDAATATLWRATLTQHQPEAPGPDGTMRNLAFERLLQAVMRGELAFLPGAG
jgi:hypothetical protein